jgi:membrane protease YdiL (CAAX protease family)
MIGLAEEVGWTGYAVRRLVRRCGVQVTGLAVGLAWGVWHVPLFWEASSFLGALGLGLLLARLVSWLPPFRLLMVWVYDRTESLLVVVLMHVSLVVSTLLFHPAIAGAQLLVFILVWAAAVWAVAAVVVVWDRSRPPRTTGRRSVA